MIVPPNIGPEWPVWRVALQFKLSIREVDTWDPIDVLDANEAIDVDDDARAAMRVD